MNTPNHEPNFGEKQESLELIQPESDILNQVSERVTREEITSTEVQTLIDQMLEVAGGERSEDSSTPTMVGLAAPQIGVDKRIILIDTHADGKNISSGLTAVVNPEFIHKSRGTERGREGCYSTGRVCGIVNRAQSVNLTGLDRNGERFSMQLSGFPARIAQHEVDHLNGIRFPDRIADASDLHWVPLEEFGDYRENWNEWTKLCPREDWEAIKSGKSLE